MPWRQPLRLGLLTAALGLGGIVAGPDALSAQAHHDYISWTADSRALAVTFEGDVYLLPVDGGSATRLTDAPGRDAFATWSPDGSVLLFVSARDGDQEIFLANADGSNPRALTSNDVEDSWPSWSPDGKRIAFMRRAGEHWHIWIMNADGSAERPLLDAPGHEFNPDWSPDGRWILFEASRDGSGNDDLYMVRPDGSEERRLTDTPANDIYPDWSPDGASIAYCTIENGRAFVHIMDSGGGTPSLWKEDACLPQWSPDGSRLAYVSSARGQPERLFVVDLATLEETEVADPSRRDVVNSED